MSDTTVSGLLQFLAFLVTGGALIILVIACHALLVIIKEMRAALADLTVLLSVLRPIIKLSERKT